MPPRETQRSPLLSRLRHPGVYFALGVAGLAMVVLGVGALVAPRSPSTARSSTENPNGPDALYERGLTALQSGETTEAVEILERAAAAGSTTATAELERIQGSARTGGSSGGKDGAGSSKSSGESASDDDPTPPRDDSAFLEPVDDIEILLPRGFAGYQSSTLDSDKASAELPLEPRDPAIAAKARRAVVAVFDKGTAKSAEKFVSDSSKGYPKDRSTATVNLVSGRFGTDGGAVANLSFARGRFAFDVTIAASRVDPKELRDLALRIARAIPASK